jgi:AcrR family transcriptional regulator
MESDQEIKDRICTAAMEQFYIYGFNKVTVDEIAAKLGMSKKTIYKYFPSKDELVQEVTRMTIAKMDVCCQSFLKDETTDFVVKLKNMMTFVAVQYAKMGRPLMEDLEKNAPHIWKEIDEYRARSIMLYFNNLLKEGVAKGVFRSDVDRELILMIYNNTIQNIIRPEVLSQVPFTAAQVFEAIIKIIFEGILTDEAKPRYLSNNAL